VGLLDELEQEAQRRQASSGDAARRKAEREEIFRTQIEPGMAALYAYLQKLTANLKILTPKKPLRYQLAGYGELVGYIEHDYELQTSAQSSSRDIKLQFHCALASEECPTIEVQGATKIKAVAGAFQRFHLGGMLDPKKDASGEVVKWVWELEVARFALRHHAIFEQEAPARFEDTRDLMDIRAGIGEVVGRDARRDDAEGVIREW